MLWVGDARWWPVYGAEVERDFQGERWTGAVVDGTRNMQVVDEPGLSLNERRIHFGGNAGYQAIGLAFAWGVARIVLLGYDMLRGARNESHFHGDHDGKLPNLGDLKDWARRMVQLGAELRDQGVEVINASRRTALVCFEQAPIHKALYPMEEKFARGFTAALNVRADLLPNERNALYAGLHETGHTIKDGFVDVEVRWGTHKGPNEGNTVILAENGYINKPEPHVALALGGHNGAGTWPNGGPERWDSMGIRLSPWRKHGSHILVCPSRGIGQQPQPADWAEKTVAALRQHTDREIRVRPHPGNWKQNAQKIDASLEKDLEGAWACVTWASTAGLKALIAGIPVIYTAPNWIGASAASNDLSLIENPPMPERLPMFRRMAWAQWTLDEIATGEPIRALAKLTPLTVLCVLKSGGDYDAEYVRKLRDGVARNLTIPHRFVCLSDVPVPCERIPLRHGWKGWWSKLEIFRPDVITGRTLYLDLDTVIVGNMDSIVNMPNDFSMLNIRAKDTHVGNSGAMWIAKPFPDVYEKFAEKPEYWIDYHEQHAHNRYMGDQAFISDCFRNIPKLHHALPGFFMSYKYDRCQQDIPSGCSVVCFGGKPRPRDAGGWVKRVWV